MFIEKVKALKRDASSVIYKITNTSRVSVSYYHYNRANKIYNQLMMIKLFP